RGDLIHDRGNRVLVAAARRIDPPPEPFAAVRREHDRLDLRAAQIDSDPHHRQDGSMTGRTAETGVSAWISATPAGSAGIGRRSALNQPARMPARAAPVMSAAHESPTITASAAVTPRRSSAM